MSNKTASIMSVSSDRAINLYENKYKYEWSTKGLKRDIYKMYLYETKPVKKVTGYLLIKSKLVDNPIEFSNKHGEQFTDDIETFVNKYKDKDQITFYEIEKVVKFNSDEYLDLDELGIKSAPQSIIYVKDEYDKY